MDDWTKIVDNIKQTIQGNVSAHPELKPLLTFLANFDRKYRGSEPPNSRLGIHQFDAAGNAARLASILNKAGLVLLDLETFTDLEQTIRRQDEEIEALEYRIKRLLER
jgi:hypothetical protein